MTSATLFSVILFATAGPAAPTSGATAAKKAPAGAMDDEVQSVATRYLQALVKGNDPSAKSLLLGGIPLAAKHYTIPNWKIVAREAPLVENKRVHYVRQRMRKLDRRGAEALSAIVKASRFPDDVTRKTAGQLLGKTRKEAKAFRKDFPVFARVARVGKDVFWHPNNPWRKVVKAIGDEGTYNLEVHILRIEEREANRPPRVWPLRILRITTTEGYDSGFRVLPASDWDPEY